MNILSIETSTSVCSAALSIGGVSVVAYSNADEPQKGTNHAALLPTYTEQILNYVRDHQLTLDAIALSEGPGSYTGLRIGTSLAKGLCYGLNIPLIPIGSLTVLAASAAAGLAGQSLPSRVALCPMTDARRMEVYTQFLNTDLTPMSDINAWIVDSEREVDAEEVYYFGDGAAKCQEVLPHWHYLPGIVPDARVMGLLAEIRLTNNDRIIRGTDIAYFDPFYLKEFIAAPSHVKGLE